MTEEEWSESGNTKDELWFEVARIYTSLFPGLGKAVIVKTYHGSLLKYYIKRNITPPRVLSPIIRRRPIAVLINLRLWDDQFKQSATFLAKGSRLSRA